MAQYEVFAAPDGYLLDVQTDYLAGLNVRAVVPLIPSDRAPKPAGRLNPEFVVAGRTVLMVTQYIAAVPQSALGKPTDTLRDQADRITAALDMLFHGF